MTAPWQYPFWAWPELPEAAPEPDQTAMQQWATGVWGLPLAWIPAQYLVPTALPAAEEPDPAVTISDTGAAESPGCGGAYIHAREQAELHILTAADGTSSGPDLTAYARHPYNFQTVSVPVGMTVRDLIYTLARQTPENPNDVIEEMVPVEGGGGRFMKGLIRRAGDDNAKKTIREVGLGGARVGVRGGAMPPLVRLVRGRAPAPESPAAAAGTTSQPRPLPLITWIWREPEPAPQVLTKPVVKKSRLAIERKLGRPDRYVRVRVS